MTTTTTDPSTYKHGTIEFNKGDWSGEIAKIRFYADGTFNLYGNKDAKYDWYRLVVDGNNVSIYSIYGGRKSVADKNQYPIAEGYFSDLCNEWVVSDTCGTERVNKDVRIAAASLLFNIV